MKTHFLALIVLIVFFGIVTKSYSQFNSAFFNLTEEENKEVEKLCGIEGGVLEIVEILKTKNSPAVTDLKYSTIALKKDYEDELYKTAKNICNGTTDKGAYYSFTYDPTTNYFNYGGIYCEADWNAECDTFYDFYVPAGYQACSIDWKIKRKKGKAKAYSKPIGWYEGDSENPARFRGYRVYLETEGSKKLLAQKDGEIEIEQIRIKGILSSLDNQDRFNRGCEMPKQPIQKKTPNNKEVVDTPQNGNVFSETYRFRSLECSYKVYFNNTTDGVVNCNNYKLIGEVSKGKTFDVTVKEGESGQIKVMKVGCTNTCIQSGNYWFYANVIPKNLTQNKIIPVKAFYEHSSDCKKVSIFCRD